MAMLFDKKREKYIELIVYSIGDPDWLSYKLSGGEILKFGRNELFKLDREDLFFHNSYEKEVEIIISNLLDIKRKRHYVFQPKDEGEFLLSVVNQQNAMLVKLLLRQVSIVDKNKICDFVFELETTDALLSDFLFMLQKEYSNIDPTL